VKNALPRLSALSLAVAAIAASSAAGHGGGSHVGFQARVSYLEPQQPGVLVQVLRGHEQLSLANLTPKTIVVPGAENRPAIRIEPGTTEVWTEPRIGAGESPPEREGLVRNWRIRGTIDGAPFAIVGFLGYRPPPGATQDDEDGLPTWALALLIGGGALVLAAVAALPMILRRGET
jgi:hypothetical protein